MADKVKSLVSLDKELVKKLWDYIHEAYPESTYGALSAEIQNAVASWLRLKHTQIHTEKVNPGVPLIHQVCGDIVRILKEAGAVNQCRVTDAEKVIATLRGSDPRTLKKWMNNLTRHGYMKRLNYYIFEIL